VPENTVLDILKGKSKSLINAAKLAATDSSKLSGKVKNTLIIDCISRVLFLEDDFSKELIEVKKAIKSIDSNIIPEGVLTLGEISSQEGYLEFYNKTIVIGLLYE